MMKLYEGQIIKLKESFEGYNYISVSYPAQGELYHTIDCIPCDFDGSNNGDYCTGIQFYTDGFEVEEEVEFDVTVNYHSGISVKFKAIIFKCEWDEETGVLLNVHYKCRNSTNNTIPLYLNVKCIESVWY